MQIMTYLRKRPVGALFLSTWCALAGAAEPTTPAAEPGVFAQAWDSVTDTDAWQGEGNWRLAVAPVAPHFRYSAEHRRVWAVAVERQRPDEWLAGFSFFSNSFGQPSAYAYVGRRYPGLLGEEPLFFQWSAGVLYGYVGKYKDKVALNVAGFAPGALVGLGWQFDPHFTATVHLLGDAALMLQLSYDLH
jgi:hypothetical protein